MRRRGGLSALGIAVLLAAAPASAEPGVKEKVEAARKCAAKFVGKKPEELTLGFKPSRFADSHLSVSLQTAGASPVRCAVNVARDGRCEVAWVEWTGPPDAGAKPISREQAVAIARRFLHEKGINPRARGLPDEPRIDDDPEYEHDRRVSIMWVALLNLPGIGRSGFFRVVTVQVALTDGRVTSFDAAETRPARTFHPTVGKHRAVDLAAKALGRKTPVLATPLGAIMDLQDEASHDPEVDGKQWLRWSVGFEVRAADWPQERPVRTDVIIDAETGEVMQIYTTR